MTIAPMIETDRLLLREPVLADWPGFAQLMTSDRAAHMGGPYSIANAWGVFCHGIALWRLFGVGNLSIVLRESGRCIGQVEINQGPRFPEPELGWQLDSAAEGRGYAFEAAVAMRDWACRVRGLETLVSYIGPENVRSIRLAERLGATLDAHARPQDPGDLVYRHAQPEATV
ncbi:GNAT family N-acetyltransferase [Elioraea rosea]|uniref:GNAT family N-acetyltransferase n=1 Tax=Elioraea rosea TaxID=2492390 RepID=UPI00118338A6|nr:GNAT family N-acetyltransferase [Elioraea rosea]